MNRRLSKTESPVMRFVAIGLLVTCSVAAAQLLEPTQPEIDALASWLAHEWPDRLHDSEDAEHLLVGALLTQAPMTRSSHSPESFFRKALTRDPSNALIVFDLADYCLGHSGSALCDSSVFTRLTELDSESGAVWALRALQSDRTGNRTEALDHLRRAATSKDFDAYFMRHMILFDQALRAWRQQSTAERFVMTMGFAAGVAAQNVEIVTTCRERAASDLEWRHQCLQLGSAMERHARTEMTSLLGLAMQVATLELGRDTDALAEARARRDARRAHSRTYDRVTESIDSLLENDRFWNEYFTLYVNDGEETARAWADQRAGEIVSKQ
jgi:hypothetical protein